MRDLICQCCGLVFREEVWRKNDGPSKDGGWYCVDCIAADCDTAHACAREPVRSRG